MDRIKLSGTECIRREPDNINNYRIAAVKLSRHYKACSVAYISRLHGPNERLSTAAGTRF